MQIVQIHGRWAHDIVADRATILLFVFSLVATFLEGPGAHCKEYTEQKQSLNQHCKKKLSFKSIAEFNEFVEDLREIDEKGAGLQFEKGLVHLDGCLMEKEPIYALHELVNNYEKERPCKYSEVTKLEDYAKKYLLHNTQAKTLNFFTLFGVSIGITCRINLLAHLKQADSEADQLDFIYSIASPSGWSTLINEYTKKSMKFSTSGHPDSHVINRIAQLVPGLSQIDQLSYLNFNHAMNDAESSQHASRESGTYELKSADLRPKVVESLHKIIESCKNLDKFYVNSVLSMAKLKSLDLMVDFLNDLHDRSALLHKWLVATSFCQLMARVNMVTPNGDSSSQKPTIEYEIIHSDNLLRNRHKLYSYAAPFEEIHERAKELAWQAMVNEGSWRQKSDAMWQPNKQQPAISIAMKLLVQYIRGVENDIQQGLDDSQ